MEGRIRPAGLVFAPVLQTIDILPVLHTSNHCRALHSLCVTLSWYVGTVASLLLGRNDDAHAGKKQTGKRTGFGRWVDAGETETEGETSKERASW